MSSLNITINGQKITAQAGQTILEAANNAGIDIPTLCHHPALKPIGACRVCLVEVSKQRSLQPACTFPVAQGMEVQTESPKVIMARKFVLELIFSERNHFCMYCEMSGDCELQALGYRYGLDHWIYPAYTQRFPVDASASYFMLDHNRCVLCRRCVRACSEIAANHSLNISRRGSVSMVSADMNMPIGESSCVSCGVCLDACPTGALADKHSAFLARDAEAEHVQSVCSQCSIGCGIDIVSRGGKVLRIQGDWNAPVNKGMLCRKGRFDPLYDNRQRILFPRILKNGVHKEAGWDEVIQEASIRIREVHPHRVGVLTTTHATNEAMQLLESLFRRELQTVHTALLNPVVPRLKSHRGTLADISKSDCILAAGTDPVNEHPAASFMVKRAVDAGARLILLEDKPTGLTPFADLVLKISDVMKAVEIVEQAEFPVILHGPGITMKTLETIGQSNGKAVFAALQPGVNTHAAVDCGLNGDFDLSAVDLLFVLAGEQKLNIGKFMKKVHKESFVIAQASYVSPLTDRANIVLPMAIWSEQSGTLTNTDGTVREMRKVNEPVGQSKQDSEILSLLSERIARKVET